MWSARRPWWFPEACPITNGNRALELEDVIVGARIHVKGSRAGDTITATSIMVQQTGLDSETLTGVVSDLAGACPTRTFKFGSRIIAVNASTNFVQGSCAELSSSGATIEVKGFARTDGSGLATMVKFNKGGDDGADKLVEVSGVPLGLSGQAPCPHVPRREPRDPGRNGATVFLAPGATLANGQSVNVKGKETGNGTVNASQVQ